MISKYLNLLTKRAFNVLGLFSKNKTKIVGETVVEVKPDFTSFLTDFTLDFDSVSNDKDEFTINVLGNEVPNSIFKYRNHEDYFHKTGLVVSVIDPEAPHFTEKWKAAIVVSNEKNDFGRLSFGDADKNTRTIHFIFKKNISFSIYAKSTVLAKENMTSEEINHIFFEFKLFLESIFTYMSSHLATVPKLYELTKDFDVVVKLLKNNDNKFLLDTYKSICTTLIYKMKELELEKVKKECERKYEKSMKWVNSF